MIQIVPEFIERVVLLKFAGSDQFADCFGCGFIFWIIRCGARHAGWNSTID